MPEEPKDPQTEQNPKEVKQALQLYKALNNPQSGPKVIEMLASAYNMQVATQQQAPKPSAKDELTNELGPDYELLAEKLGPALEKLLEKKITESINPLLQGFTQLSNETVEAKLERETNGAFKAVKSEVDRLSQTFQRPPNVSEYDYKKNLFELAAKGNAEVTAIQERISRQQKNFEKADLLPESINFEDVKAGPAKPSVKDAVSAAIQGQRFID